MSTSACAGNAASAKATPGSNLITTDELTCTHLPPGVPGSPLTACWRGEIARIRDMLSGKPARLTGNGLSVSGMAGEQTFAVCLVPLAEAELRDDAILDERDVAE